MPRPMPFTEALGTQLLELEEEQIAVLINLNSNLTITSHDIKEISEKRRRFNSLTIQSLMNSILNDINLLSKVYEAISPQYKLIFYQNKKPELAYKALNRIAKNNNIR